MKNRVSAPCNRLVLLLVCHLPFVLSAYVTIGIVVDGTLVQPYTPLLDLAVSQASSSLPAGYTLNYSIVYAETQYGALGAANLLIQNNPTIVLVDISVGREKDEFSKAVDYASSRNVVSHISTSTSDDMSDRVQYPYFARIYPSDSACGSMLASVVSETWGGTTTSNIQVGLIYSTSTAASINAYKAFVVEATVQNIQIQITEPYYTGVSTSDIIETIKNGKVYIIIIIADDPTEVLDLLLAANDGDILGSPYSWVGSSGMLNINTSSLPGGSIVGLIGVRATLGFGATYDSLLSSLDSTNLPTNWGYVYDIVTVVAKAILNNTVEGTQPLTGGIDLYSSIKGVTFTGLTGSVRFDSIGNRLGTYDVLNFKEGAWVSVQRRGVDTIDISPIVFSNNATTPPVGGTQIVVGLVSPFNQPHGRQWASVASLATNEINQQQLLPFGRQMKLIVMTDNYDPSVGIVNSLALVNDYDAVAIIGSPYSFVSTPMALVLSIFETPQISFYATSNALSNKAQYPYFVRDIAPDSVQGDVLARVCKYYGWDTVGTVNTREDYGSTGISVFATSATNLGINIVTLQTFTAGTVDLSDVAAQLHQSKVRVIVAFVLNPDDCLNLWSQVKQYGMLGEDYSWLVSDGCAGLTESSNYTNPDIVGVLGLFPSFGTGQVLTDFRAKISNLNPLEYPGCGTTDVDPVSSYAYDSAYMMAYGLLKLLNEGGSPSNGSMLLAKLYQTNFTGITGPVFINTNGDRIGQYSFLNWKNVGGAFSQVGYWDPVAGLQVTDGVIFLGGGSTPPTGNIPSSAIIVTVDTPALALAIGILTGLATVVALLLSAGTIIYWKHLRYSSPLLCLLIIFGALCGYAAIFTLLPSPPTHNTCLAFPWLVGVAFMTLFGTLCMKTWRVWRVFEEADKLKVLKISKSYFFGAISSLVLFEVMYLIAWSVVDPPLAKQVNTYQSGTQQIQCISNSTGFWAASLAYKGLFLLLGTYLAFKTRNVHDFFNESKQISLAMYNVAVSLAIAIALGVVLQDIPNALLVIEAFAVLIPTTVTIGILFIPQLFKAVITAKRGERPLTAFRSSNVRLETFGTTAT